MDQDPWLHFWGLEDFPDKAVLLDCLQAAGIRTRPFDPEAAASEGILCCAELGQDLCELLNEVSNNGIARILVIPTAQAASDASQVWRLRGAGASDVLTWSTPADIAQRVKARIERWHAVDELVQSPTVQAKLVGISPVWRSLLRQVIEVARFTSASVLFVGESGTGKEWIARLVHELDPRACDHELVVLDCTTIVPELSGSEFFGHERGAFTGAVGARDGAFATADDGTLFLDEVGELPMSLQAQLLRVVQEGTYKRVGGNVWHRTRFRLVCATNRNLEQARERGEFRNDFYYRIASWVFRLPPLAERREDILPLAHHFLRLQRPDNPCLEFDRAVREFLLARAYPGNVRDLQQLMARIASRHVGPGPITIGDVPLDESPTDGASPGIWRNSEFDRSIRHALAMGAGLKEIGQAATDAALRIAIGEEGGNLQAAAHRLGVTDRALQMRRAARRRHNGSSPSQEVK